MTTLQLVWLSLGSSWAAIEAAIALKTRTRIFTERTLEFRSERLIWCVVAAALLASLWLKQQHLLPIPLSVTLRQCIALPIFAAGLVLRCYAVLALGRFFSTTVITQAQHSLINTGPYRFIRHPAYSGLLAGFLGAGIAMGDMLALFTLVCPIIYVLLQRMHVEEQQLLEHFGEVYRDYCLRTKRLAPWVY